MMSYKYRLYPNKEQEHKLFQTLGSCRFCYNHLLDALNTAKATGTKLTQVETQAMLVSMKEEHPFLKEVNAKALQMVNYTLWSNIKALSRLKKNGKKIGRLRFKGRGRYNTINYNQSGYKFMGDKLRLSKIGDIKIKMHRPLTGNVKGVFVKHSAGRWYAIAQVDVEPCPLEPTNRQVGIDVGLDHLMVDSDGRAIANPKHIDQSQEQLKSIQRKISRCKKGSNNRQKWRLKLERQYEKVNNQRNDYLHKVSRYYVDNYDTIMVENLDINGMMDSRDKHKTAMHRHIADASWGRFVQMLCYKAESAGRTVVKVDPKDTSQKCSQCDALVPKKIWHRTHSCPNCGFVADRDYNASVNILKSGSGRPAGPVECISLSEVTPAMVTSGQISTMMQEAPSSNAIGVR